MVVVIAGGVVTILSLACDCRLVGCCEQFGPKNTRGEVGVVGIVCRCFAFACGAVAARPFKAR